MKKSLILLSVAALVLGACSSDEPTQETTGGITDGTAYLNVTIAMPTTTGSRAASDGGYANGTTEESTVSKAVFFLYDANGTYLATSSTSFSSTSTQTNGSNVETQTSAVVAFGPTTIDTGATYKLITIVNMQSTDYSAYQTSLTEALKATTNHQPSAAGSFEMSSSAYNDGSNDLRYNEVSGESFKTTSAEAMSNPIVVYVERTVTRVDVEYTGQATTNVYKVGDGSATGDLQVTIDGVTYTALAVKILGQRANIVNKSGYMVKNINSATEYKYFSGTKGVDLTGQAWAATRWSNSNDFRSYWAEDANYNTTGNTDLEIYTFNDVNGKTKSSEYVFENTIDHSVTGTSSEAVATYAKYAPGEDDANVTTLCVVAQVGYYSNTSFTPLCENGTVYRINGLYYTETGLKKAIASALSNSYSTSEGALTENDIEVTATSVTSDTQKEVIGYVSLTAKPAQGKTIYEGTSGSGTSVSSLTLPAPYNKNIEAFLNGYCYYQVPIEQALDSESSGTLYGVVRNHVYEITVSGVSKVGNPVYDTNEPLTPIPGDEQYYYLSAQINVLAWRKVTQSVTL